MMKTARRGNRSLRFGEREAHEQRKERTLPQSSDFAPVGYGRVDRADNLAGFFRDCGEPRFQLGIVGEIHRIGGELLHDPEFLLELNYSFDTHGDTVISGRSQCCSILDSLKNRLLPAWLGSHYPVRGFLTFITI
jgi:hypothetical protein